jgi:transcription-repair coupling factor (superfamily II helicase)
MDKVLSEIKNEAFNVAPEDKGEKSLDIEIKNIPFDMVIPDTYIHDSVERLKIYRRLAVAKSIEPVIEMKKELEDRFGKIPDETISLLKMFIYRVNASAQGIESIEYDSTNVLKLYYKEKLNEKILQRYRYIINEKHKLAIIYSVQKWKVKKILDDLFGVKKDVI